MNSRNLRGILASMLVIGVGACADNPMGPRTGADALSPLGTNGALPADYDTQIMAVAVSNFGRPYWARNCTPRICVSLRALIVENEVTETRVAVGPDLFGPYPAAWTLDKLEYFLLNRQKGSGAWKREIITNANVPQNGQSKYHARNFTGIRDGDILCVQTHVRGAAMVTGKSTTTTELYTTCTTVRYAADIQTTIELEQTTFEWTENPTLKVTATFNELRGIMPGTFEAVLLVNGQAIESRPTQPFTAGGTVSGVVFEYPGLEPGNHTVSVVAINVLPGDYNPANNVQTKSFQVNVFGQEPPEDPPGGGDGGGGDTRSTREFCEEERTCPPRSLAYRANQQFDTTLNMSWSRAVRNGEVSTDYEVNSLTFTHEYSTSMNAVWDIDIAYPVDSISLQQITFNPSTNTWQVIDKQDATTTPALVGIVPNNGPECHEGGSNQFGFKLCREFIDGRWQTSLAYNHGRSGGGSAPDVATATLFFGPDLTNPTPRAAPGTDYQGIGSIQLLGGKVRYAMNVYLPGGKLLQAWAEMQIDGSNLGTGGNRVVFEDTCDAATLDCDQVVRYTYSGSFWKRGGQAIDNARGN